MSTPSTTPTPEEISELLDCARYGDLPQDLDDIKQFVEKYGAEQVAQAKDDRQNTVLHLAGANGHLEIFSYLLPLLPATTLVAPNAALSTPLHWIALNYHLPLLRLLCPLLPPTAYTLLNAKGKTAVQEAEEACEAFVVPDSEMDGAGKGLTDRAKERVRRETAVGYLLGCMGLGVKKATTKEDEAEEQDGEVGEDGETVERLTKEAEKIKLEDKP